MSANKQSNWGTCPTIYFAKVPNFQELCTVSLQVCSDSPGINNVSQFGSQPQIIKCRELIFTEPCVLASPSLQEQGLIFVIIQQSFWKTGKLQMRCQKSGLKIGKPTRVISAVFQACLSYTLRAKLAPLWNKAGDLYIQGRHFLTCSTKANAMGVEINVTDAEICIALKPTLIKLTQSDLQDFEIAPGVLEHFFALNTYTIPEYAIDDKWCSVLPSLKKGKVVSITHQIPPVSPFKTYKDIRRYWKNAYGYRLPESDAGIIYYNVYFPAIGNTLFTYPHFCVFKREPVLLPRVDPMTIIPSFLADIEAKLPNICGSPFKVNPKAQYTTAGLYQASIQNNSLSSLTLATVPPAYQRQHIPFRQLPVQQATPAGQQKPILPNRALAKAFDAAFQQAGGVCLSPRPVGNNSSVHPHSQAVYPGAPQQVRQQPNISQQFRGTNRPILPSSPLGHLTNMASVHPHSQPTHMVAYQGTPQHVGQQPSESNRHILPSSPTTCHLVSIQPHSQPTHQAGYQGTPQHVGHPLTTPICQQPREVNRHVLPSSPTGHFASVYTLSPPPHQAGYRGTPHHVGQQSFRESNRSIMPQSPCATTNHTVIQHSPLMTNSTQHVAQFYSGMPSPQPITQHLSPMLYSTRQTELPQTNSQAATLHGSFPIPTPQPQMLTPVTQAQQTSVATKVVPSFRPHKARNLLSQPPASQSGRVVPTFKPTVPRTNTPTFAAKVQLNFDKDPAEYQQAGGSVASTTQAPLKPAFVSSTQVPLKLTFGGKVPATSSHGKESDTNRNLTKTIKRKAKANDSEPTVKKPRAKPKVQEGVDMQALIVSDQLSKVNTVTLVTWLKDKNIKVKSREKKADLVAKVMDYINAKSKEN